MAKKPTKGNGANQPDGFFANKKLDNSDIGGLFAFRSVSQKRFRSGILKFPSFYSLKSLKMRYFFVIILAIIFGSMTAILVQSTGLYTGGFNACFQGIARFVYAILRKKAGEGVSDINRNQVLIAKVVYNALFWGLYLLLNIPLLIFAYKKIGKTFASLSLTFVIIAQITGFLVGFMKSSISGFNSFQVFGDTTTVDWNLNQYDIKCILFYPNFFPAMRANGSFDWSLATTNGASDQIKNMIVSDNVCKIFILLVYAVAYSLISATIYTIVFIMGGSTAGSDFIVIFWSQEKNKNVGATSIVTQGILMVVGVVFGTYCSSILVNHNVYSSWQYILSANLFISFVWTFMHGTLIDRFFPWRKFVRVEVFSQHTKNINLHLKKINYTHPSTIITAEGGYSGKPTYVYTTICMMVELPTLVREVRSLDDRCLISATTITDIDGYINLQKQTI